MAELQFLTMADTSPNQKLRIYATGLDRDLSQHLPAISGVIFSILDCAVFYAKPGDRLMTEERMEQLAEMQLFAVIVTGELLCSFPEALADELEQASRNHVPVLPLVTEPICDSDYCRHFGKAQYIAAFESSPTALPFSQQLKNYLDSTLISAYEYEHILDAFEGRIFLSYRKKDRREAQALMRYIHHIPAFEPVSIWYDEYLPLGKSFDASISEAMKSSQLILLMVTPSILEPKNYVVDQEYPDACEYGIPILPVEMVPTDRTALEKAYPGLPPVCERNDPAGLEQRLTELFQAKTSQKWKALLKKNGTNDSITVKSYRDYFMGLAYLNGVEVEKNVPRAIRLLESSADSSYFMAMKKLSEIYAQGIGVKRNDDKAVFWQKRLVNFVKKIRNVADIPANFSVRFYFNTLEHLLWQLMDLRRYEDCVPVLRDMKHLSDNRTALQKEHVIPLEFQIRYHLLNAKYEEVQRRFQDFHKHLSQIRRLMQKAGAELDAVFPAEDRADFLIQWARSCTEFQKLEEAEKSCTDCLKLLDTMEQQGKTLVTMEYRELCCYQLAKIAGYQDHTDDAVKFYQQALALSDLLTREPGHEGHLMTRGAILDGLGDIELMQGRTESALEYFRQTLDGAIAINDRSSLPEAKRDMAMSHFKCGTCLQKQKKFDDARKELQLAVNCCENLFSELANPAAEQDLEKMLLQLGILEMEAGCNEAARPLFDRAVEHADASVRKLATPEAMSFAADCCKTAADFAEQENRLTDAMDLLKKELALLKKLRHKTGRDFTEQNLKNCYLSLIPVSKALGYSCDDYRKKLNTLCGGTPGASAPLTGQAGALALIRKAQAAGSVSEKLKFVQKAVSLLDEMGDPPDSPLEEVRCYTELWRQCYYIPMGEFEQRIDLKKDYSDLMPILSRLLLRLIGLEYRLWCLTDDLRWLHNMAMFFQNLSKTEPEHDCCYLILSWVCWNRLCRLDPHNDVYQQGKQNIRAVVLSMVTTNPRRFESMYFQELNLPFPVEKLFNSRTEKWCLWFLRLLQRNNK